MALLPIEVIGFLALVFLGILLIILIKTFIFLLPASIVSFAVWYITGDRLLTGIAFLVIAALSLLKGK